MTRIRQILLITLCAVMLLGCSSPAASAKKQSGTFAVNLETNAPKADPKTAALESAQAIPEEEFREGMTELYPLNDVFLGHCLDGVSDFSVTLLKEAWAGMTLEALDETVLFIGKRWCTEDFGLRYTNDPNGAVRFHVTGAKPRDGVRMAFDINLSASDRQCLDEINAVVDGFIAQYGWDAILVETAIYDWICDHMEYHTFEEFPVGDSRREACTSAITAFREGWGNCQAYSDLFYLMATRAGLQPGYISGWAGGSSGGWHLWNFVWLDTGLSGGGNYMVDVTFGDSTESHYYLNFGTDRAVGYSWHEQLWAYGFEANTDDSLTYYGLNSMDHGLAAQTYEEIATFFVWKGQHGYASAEALIPGIYYLDGNRMKDAIETTMQKQRASGYFNFRWLVMDNGDVVVKLDWQ